MKEKTVRELVDALGGTFVVAEKLGVVPTAVSNAKAENKLPERWRYKLHAMARQKKLKGYARFIDTARSMKATQPAPAEIGTADA